MKISICIPTCNRPELLRECIESCIAQTLPPCEILVGDDSADDAASQVVSELVATTSIPIRYTRHDPPVGQAGNAQYLFERSSGEAICLIHDDDLLTERALEILAPTFDDPSVVVAYGKQFLMDHDGNRDEVGTQELNHAYFRRPEFAGVQDNILIAALAQQFPNNGYIVRADIAREVGYIKPAELTGKGPKRGFAADFGFAVSYAMHRPDGRAVFVDDFTAAYRVSKTSVARGHSLPESAFRSFNYVMGLEPEIRKHPMMAEWLRFKAPPAIAQAAALGHTRVAWGWYFSKWHRRRIPTLGGARRFLHLLKATITRGIR